MRLLLISCAFLIGCGSSGGGNSSATTVSKQLFDRWTSDSCTNWGFVDLSIGHYSSSFTAVYNFNGCKCNCNGTFTHIGDSPFPNGLYTLSSCTYEAGSCTGGYATCSSWNDNGSWTISSAQLTFASNVLPGSQQICLFFR